MRILPIITGASGQLLIALGLLGLFIERMSRDDGAVLVAGAVIFGAAFVNLRNPSG